MFTGASNLSIDAKGRIAVPTRYRDELGTDLVITADPSGCLLLFTQETWGPFAERVSALPNMNSRHKVLQRVWLGYKLDCEVDNAGRIGLTPEMRAYAKFDGKVQMIGQDDRFELWSERGWQDEIDLAKRYLREEQPADLARLSV